MGIHLQYSVLLQIWISSLTAKNAVSQKYVIANGYEALTVMDTRGPWACYPEGRQ